MNQMFCVCVSDSCAGVLCSSSIRCVALMCILYGARWVTRLAQVSDIHCLVAITMPTWLHNDETLRQIQELSEEYDIRRKETLDTFAYWKGHQGCSAEYHRQLMIITEETREQLQILVGYPIPLVGSRVPSLLRAFAEALRGYRAPSRSRSRSGSRWQHPVEHSYELEPP